MVEGKIIFRYDKDTGYGHMNKQNRFGSFFASTAPVEEDYELKNEWDAQRFCELQCDIQYYKRKWQIARERAKGAQIVYDNLTQNGEDCPRLRKQVIYLVKDAAAAKERYETMRDCYKGYTENMLRTRKMVLEKKNKKIE